MYNNNNGNRCSAFGNSKRFAITLECAIHEKKKKKKQNSGRRINDIIKFKKFKKQACYQIHSEMHAHTQAGRHAHRQTDRQTDTDTHTRTHTTTEMVVGVGVGGGRRKENRSYYLSEYCVKR